ncbi:MBL fold metallo-hydrolase [Paenibacillus allorhizosphaerae]|uniref:Metallo-beta-lactamase domain-containing protein n=1 Tax=Paenibacillus allorhizosphaerae TaxID=2849866 RepID=A0ABN7TEB4_9BACL|nr:MBL fold metallo-hydrolase [Paenibacillus allorhizosphaerae]CAG7627709.1 hypothetical protein PAECIP111802_01381 [Paenibacillus allorhizosphaerae]
MKGQIRKHGLNMIGIGTVSALLFAAACSHVNPEPKRVAAPLQHEQSKDELPTLRTNEVFDKEKYKGKLQLRYFHLKDPKVSAGDSYLIITPDGKAMLMDGGFANVGNQVVRYLDKLGIKDLDILYNTHPHPDHLGGFAEVLKTKEAKAYYRQSFDNNASAQYRNTIEQIERKNIPQKVLAAGDKFELGGDVKFEVLSPKKEALNDVIKTNDDATINFYSLVVKMTYKDTSFLFPGEHLQGQGSGTYRIIRGSAESGFCTCAAPWTHDVFLASVRQYGIAESNRAEQQYFQQPGYIEAL